MFGLDHPEKITDFAYRAMHETVVKAKLIAAAFYGTAPKYSYYNGCSTGGRQGLFEATRFPDDFDAIAAV
jgi:feruloyl esterase